MEPSKLNQTTQDFALSRQLITPSVSERSSILHELVFQQLPIVLVIGLAGCLATRIQHGVWPNADGPFPIAGVAVPIWHLLWMGFWTGYLAALIGQAAGIFALPYEISILQFSNVYVTPTTLLLTFLNPIGALLGFRRSRQWNLEFAFWVCVGGALGAIVGPFVRLEILPEPRFFNLAAGIALLATGGNIVVPMLFGTGTPRSFERKVISHAAAQAGLGKLAAGIPPQVHLCVTAKERWRLTLEYWGERWVLHKAVLFFTGFGVAVFAVALGIGGGFLLVPIFTTYCRLPLYVVVAASIPYAIILSAIGLLTFIAAGPLVSNGTFMPEIAWSCYAAAGGILGSWCAAKSQRFVHPRSLNILLGGVTFVAGAYYVVAAGYVLLQGVK